MISLTKHHMVALAGLICMFIAGIFFGAINPRVFSRILPWYSSPICRHCSVVIVSLDSLRAQELLCLGYTRNTMPALCAFAKKNILFTNAHAQSTWTYPSAISVLTSLYPTSHGMNDYLLDVLHPSILTLPALYKKAGYRTVLIVNSQEKNIPFPKEITRSFDLVISTFGKDIDEEIQTWTHELSTIDDPRAKPLFLYVYTTFLGYYNVLDIGEVSSFPLDPSFIPPRFSDFSIFIPTMIDIIKNHLTFHIQHHTGSLSIEMYQNILTKLNQSKNLENARQMYELLPQGERKVIYQEAIGRQIDMTNPIHRTYVQNLYDHRLAELDNHLSSFLTQFENTTLNKSTILAIYADHGENVGDHGLWGHATKPFDTLTHVPLILHIPYSQNLAVTELTELIDLYPTLLRLTGLSIPHNISGADLTPILFGQSRKSPSDGFAITQLKSDTLYQSIRTKDWRLTISSGKMTHGELYNLASDPKEVRDVMKDYPNLTEQLIKLLDSAIEKTPKYPQTNLDIDPNL